MCVCVKQNKKLCELKERGSGEGYIEDERLK